MQNKSRAFTLIELLVVVLIIGILAAVAVPQYQKAVLKTRYTQVQLLGRSLQEAVNMYRLANNAYPTSLEDLDIQFPGTLSNDRRVVSVEGKYFCYLDVRENYLDSLWCELWSSQTGGLLLAYRVFLDNRRFCVTNKNGELLNEICKLMGGKNPFDNGSGLMHYQLP